MLKSLAIREQRQADGVSLDGCYNCGIAGHIVRDCPTSRQDRGGSGWNHGGGRGGRGGGRSGPSGHGPSNQGTIRNENGRPRLLKEEVVGNSRKSQASSGKFMGGFITSLQWCLQEASLGVERGCLHSTQAPEVVKPNHHLVTRRPSNQWHWGGVAVSDRVTRQSPRCW